MERLKLTNEIAFSVSIPAQPLWPNARPHHHTKAKATKVARHAAAVECAAAMACDDSFPWPSAFVRCTFYFGDARTRDRDNCLAAMKAVFDGMADAGLIENDSELTHLPVERSIDRANPRVDLRVMR